MGKRGRCKVAGEVETSCRTMSPALPFDTMLSSFSRNTSTFLVGVLPRFCRKLVTFALDAPGEVKMLLNFMPDSIVAQVGRLYLFDADDAKSPRESCDSAMVFLVHRH